MKEKLNEHLVIRVSKATKENLMKTAQAYGMHHTQLGRHLIVRELPNIQKKGLFVQSELPPKLIDDDFDVEKFVASIK